MSRGRQIAIVATSSDLVNIAKSVSDIIPLQFAPVGGVEESFFCVTEDVDGLSFDNHIATERGENIIVEVIDGKGMLLGRKIVMVGLSKNRRSVLIQCSTVYRNVLQAGRIATLAENKKEAEIYDCFVKLIRSTFRKAGTYFVGPDALRRTQIDLELPSVVGSQLVSKG